MNASPLADDDVAALYQYLLGRDPESPGTVAAFRNYYPTLAAGRRAILASDEFRRAHPDLALPGSHPAGRLAQAFLARAGGARPAAAAFLPPEIATATSMMLGRLASPRLALVLGNPDADLASLAPLGPGGAVLHAAAGHPAFIPLLGTMPTGATLFRIANEPAALAALLAAAEVSIDLLVQLEPGAANLPLSPNAIIVAGPGAEPPDRGDLEILPALHGFQIFHSGNWHLPVHYSAPSPPPPVSPDEFPALAIAVIARNEAAALPHMLASALPIASFVAIADTGSDDNTAETARAVLGASGKPHVVVGIPSGRFDTMRNAALDLVPEWVEWVLMLDADEALAPEDHAPLLALLRHKQASAYALPRYNYRTPDGTGEVMLYPDRQIRLFRNSRKIRYSGAVHETIRDVTPTKLPLDAAALGLARGGPHIHHFVRRFRTPAQEDRKQAYYRELAATG